MNRVSCPCCRSQDGITIFRFGYSCIVCGHHWQKDPLGTEYYTMVSGRNSSCPKIVEGKIKDRLKSILPFLKDGIQIIEVGCAEGHLGFHIKSLAKVSYVGLEISSDAEVAMTRLDRVIQSTAANCLENSFDLLMAFHVLEHIPDVLGEIEHWKRLLNPNAYLIIEVPNGPGHPLLEHDTNAEHAHQFTSASLLVLLKRCGINVLQLTTGHFESPVYPDSIRVIATLSMDAEQRARRLHRQFLSCLGDRFVVYGAGGDFKNYIEPLLSLLPVAAVCDTNPKLKGHQVGNHKISPYDPISLCGLPIIIASSRHQHEITNILHRLGVPDSDIHYLDEIYGMPK